MNYIYATLLLNEAGKEVNAANMKKVVESVGVKADEARIKAVLAALEGVDIKDVISKSASVVAAAPAAGAKPAAEAKPEEPEEEEVSQEEAAAGLGALFG